MKSLLIVITLLIGTVHYSFGQKKVTKFCEVTTREVGFSTGKLKPELIYGKSDSLTAIKGSKFEAELKKVVAMTTVPDVLDYIYSLGWSLVGETAVGAVSHFYFKKEFNESELLIHWLGCVLLNGCGSTNTFWMASSLGANIRADLNFNPNNFFDVELCGRLTAELYKILRKCRDFETMHHVFEPDSFSRLSGFDFNIHSKVKGQLSENLLTIFEGETIKSDYPGNADS